MTSDRSNIQALMSVACTALVYFAVGLPLAVLPSWVHHELGFSVAMAGFAVSIQYAATIVSRGIVGPLIDTAGPRRAILIGFALCLLSGLVFVGAARTESHRAMALAVLLASRVVLGFGESMVGTSSIAWGIVRAGRDHTAKVISWNGIAIYGGIAAGAPVGVGLLHYGGMTTVGLALLLTGLGGWVFTWPQPTTEVSGAERMPYTAVFARILPYGAALGLGAVGFGVITSFVALYYAAHGWAAAWMAITGFGVAFVLGRILFVGLIARLGGLRVASMFLAVEVVGLLTMWLATTPIVAVIGAALAGVGFALVFPALGLIVVDLVPPQNRGAALGAYNMFTDVALLITGPAAGLAASGLGYPAPFLLGGLCACLGLGIVCIMRMRLRSDELASEHSVDGWPVPLNEVCEPGTGIASVLGPARHSEI